jgi:hypothetical protein
MTTYGYGIDVLYAVLSALIDILFRILGIATTTTNVTNLMTFIVVMGLVTAVGGLMALIVWGPKKIIEMITRRF